MTKSKLFLPGSSGCIFRPQIPCGGKNSKKTKKTKKKVTKLVFNKKNKEYKIGRKIKSIKGYKEWTLLWNDICLSPDYQDLIKDTDINECLKTQNYDVNRIPHTFNFLLFQGDYGGLTLENYVKQQVTKKILMNQTKFISFFKKIFKLLQNVFYGLAELYKHKVCHHDINILNIIVNKNKSYIIDYDISIILNHDLKNNDFLMKRMVEEYDAVRLYESYPFEYIYYKLNDPEHILNEQQQIALYQNRINYYEIYDPIHHKIFFIDTDTLRFELLEDKLQNTNKQNLNHLMSKLDMYSLGVMILILFIDSYERLDISLDVLVKNLKSEELKPYMNLIKDMIEFDYRDRIDPIEAYERYLNLI